MTPRKRDFDISAARNVPAPSPAFQQFVRQYFTDYKYYVRREEDRSLPGRLIGVEREVAIEMILSNLRTWHSHLIDAAARLQLDDAVPTLQAMLNDEYGKDDAFCIEQFSVRTALFQLGAMDYPVFATHYERDVSGNYILAQYVLLVVNMHLAPVDARRVIDLGLRRADYSTRAYAYRAAVELQYILSHGGSYSGTLASEVMAYRDAAVTIGSEQPMYYEQLQYYVGDVIYRNKEEFERRLAELWSVDPSARTVPLFTEINRGHGKF